MRHDRLMTRRAVVVALVGLMGSMLVNLPGSGVDAQSPAQELPEQRLEIVMRDYDFQVLKPVPIRPGMPTVIIVRNQDIVRHGFYSPMLQGILIRTPSFRGVAEEAPGAYKDVSAVVDAADEAKLARKVARLEPLVCVKG